MSSHHIVREKQEPALLVLGLQNFSFELLGQLLEWSPTLIATDKTVEHLDADQIKVDWLLTDKTSSELQTNIKIIPLNKRDEVTVAMDKLLAEGYPAVNVVTDNFQSADYLKFAGKIDVVIYQDNKKIYPVKSGFSKWKPVGDVIEMIDPPVDLICPDWKSLDGNRFQMTADGFFTVNFKQPFLFLSEEV